MLPAIAMAADDLSGMHLTTPLPRDRALAVVVTVGTAVQLPRTPPGWVAREQWHSWQFMLVTHGEGEAEFDRRSQTAGVGAAMLMPRDRAHRYRRLAASPLWRYRWVEFAGEQVPTLLAMLGLGDAWVVPDCGEVQPHIERVHQLLLTRGDDALHEATTLFLYALALVAKRARQRPEAAPTAVERAVAWMALHLHTPVLLNDVATVAGVSPWHCVRLFRAAHGVPPLAYLRLMRVQRAKALLHDGDLAVRQVARAVGYARVQHFTRMFTRSVGMPPSIYRKGAVRT